MSLFVGRNRYLPARFLGAAILCAKSGKTCFTCSFFENRKKTFFFTTTWVNRHIYYFSVWSLVHTISVSLSFLKKSSTFKPFRNDNNTPKTETKFAKMWTLRRYRWPLSESKFNTALTRQTISDEIICANFIARQSAALCCWAASSWIQVGFKLDARRIH